MGCKHIPRGSSARVIAERAALNEHRLADGRVYQSFKCKKCGREAGHRIVEYGRRYSQATEYIMGGR